ncbi:MAG: restriction endonuclease subunit S [Clostridia bacterium]|nr:restriction endonuclease subunit S [Clostridia bacterium]
MSFSEFLWGKVPEEWDIKRLDEVSSYISRGKQPKYVEYSEIRTLNQKSIRWFNLQEENFKFQNPEIPVPDKHFIKKNDVVLNSTGVGTVGRALHFDYQPKKLFADSHVTIIRTNKNYLNSRFLMYQLSTREYQSFIENSYLAGSTGQVEFNKSKVMELPILLPSIEEQNKIVEYLYKIDKKIEINNQINKNLEEMTQAIFKQWFLNFEFPNEKGQPYKSCGGEMEESELGMIPKGWHQIELRDIIDVNPKYKLKKGVEYKFVSMKELRGNSSSINLDDVIYKVYKSGGMKFSNGDTLLARITPCLENGKTAYIDFLNEDKIGWGSTEFIVLRMKHRIKHPVSYVIARNDSFRQYAIKHMTGSSGRQRVSRENIENYKLFMPKDLGLLKKFGEFIEPLFNEIRENTQENQKLIGIRDILLPKLMSGEIRVNLETEGKVL